MRRARSRRIERGRLAMLAALTVLACTPESSAPPSPETEASATEASATEAPAPHVPQPDLAGMEAGVAQRLRETRGDVLTSPLSAKAWGAFGRVAHAHELWEEALVAYRQAEKLDPQDPRWPYYLGDVLSVVGTDLAASAQAFRRAMKLRPDYPPAHMRLGQVLLADGRTEAAARELERALELAGDLQPARVTLGQVRLSQGRLDSAESLLEEVLGEQPRHAQALSTLGQVYMRQGRRGEAREIAARARDAALYNLFDDPLMSEVVAEEASSVLIWERAKAFLDNGNYEQARRGLEQVIQLRPASADAHQQLATTYGKLGDLERSRTLLARVVELDPERVDALVQLAMVDVEEQRLGAAIPVLRRVLELAPDDPDARWLLARALVLSGDVAGGLQAFEQASARGGEPPVWARNEWGSALAQSGRPEEALAQFRATLEAEPNSAQAWFYAGLIHEGLGRIAEARDHYCRSLRAQPNPPAQSRLQALGHVCP